MPSLAEALSALVGQHLLGSADLRLVILSGEPADRDHLQRTRENLSDKVAAIYALAELGIVGFSPSGEGRYALDLDRFFIEIVDDAGRPCGFDRPGRIVVTTLSEMDFPLIRYDTGDIGRILDEGKSAQILSLDDATVARRRQSLAASLSQTIAKSTRIAAGGFTSTSVQRNPAAEQHLAAVAAGSEGVPAALDNFVVDLRSCFYLGRITTQKHSTPNPRFERLEPGIDWATLPRAVRRATSSLIADNLAGLFRSNRRLAAAVKSVVLFGSLAEPPSGLPPVDVDLLVVLFDEATADAAMEALSARFDSLPEISLSFERVGDLGRLDPVLKQRLAAFAVPLYGVSLNFEASDTPKAFATRALSWSAAQQADLLERQKNYFFRDQVAAAYNTMKILVQCERYISGMRSEQVRSTGEIVKQLRRDWGESLTPPIFETPNIGELTRSMSLDALRALETEGKNHLSGGA
jgi:hypothetical protein